MNSRGNGVDVIVIGAGPAGLASCANADVQGYPQLATNEVAD